MVPSGLGAKLLSNQFDKNLVETLVQDRCSSWAQLVHRGPTLAVDVLEDHLTEPQRAVVPTPVGLCVPGWKSANNVVDAVS